MPLAELFDLFRTCYTVLREAAPGSFEQKVMKSLASLTCITLADKYNLSMQAAWAAGWGCLSQLCGLSLRQTFPPGEKVNKHHHQLNKLFFCILLGVFCVASIWTRFGFKSQPKWGTWLSALQKAKQSIKMGIVCLKCTGWQHNSYMEWMISLWKD